MNLHWLDWGIVAAFLVGLTIAAHKTKKYNTSVADFLAANRCAGRYILGVSDAMAGIGAISVVGMFEAYFNSGFTFVWWGILMSVVLFVVSLSGWIQYRFRQTRALTMAQFVEMRYSKPLRIATGMTAWFSGTINFGIFPAAGARFFQYFCGLPHKMVPLFPGADYEIDIVYAGIMFSLLAISLYFTFVGGQIAVIVTDFIQGTFFNIVIIFVLVFTMVQFPWPDIMDVLSQRIPGQSMLDPFDTEATKTFDKWYYIIASFVSFWCFMCWLGNQGYASAARNAHEARMGRVFGTWRIYIQNIVIIFLPIAAYTMMHHADWTTQAAQANQVLDGIGNDTIRGQVGVSVILTKFLPVCLLGGFAAVMLAAFISTHDTYLHSWGSIFIQDVVLPLRKKRLSTDQHIRLLKWSIFGVAAFILLFSLFFPQTDFILMFFALTGTLFLGGAGTIVVFGLYWKRGTTAAAWASLSIGWIAFVGGLFVDQYWPNHFGENFPDQTGEVYYDDSALICTMPVKLEPGEVYWIGINGKGKTGFQGLDGNAAATQILLFATADANGAATDIPQQMTNDAERINQAISEPDELATVGGVPRVVDFNVNNLATRIDPSLDEITVRFDTAMDRSSSAFTWVKGKGFFLRLGGREIYLDAQRRLFWAIIISIFLYVVISLLGRREVFNLDKMLHRGDYAIDEDQTAVAKTAVPRWQASLGINQDFTLRDKVVYLGIGGWTVLWCVLFFAVLLYRAKYGISAEAWAAFWHFFIWMVIVLASLTAVWFTFGGLLDLRKMFQRLKTLTRNPCDDGEILDEKD